MPDDRPGGSSATMNIRPHPERDADANRFPDPSASREVILDEWRARMRQRWAAGERAGVETFLAESPHLVEDTQALFALLLEEYDLRDKQGSPPTLDEIRTRFPSLVRPLEQYLRHRQALQRVPEPISEDAQTLDVPAHSAAKIRQNVCATQLPTVVAGHQILSELGRGGMGVVYMARHLELGRAVAIKMILSAKFACAEELMRFRVEGETAASLHHANIVQVYEVGSFEDQPYMVLEYVEGGTLSQKLRERKLGISESAHLIESLARAVHHAHSHGIVHRDLKPANILLSPGDDPAHPLGTPKIADFGLAKHLDRAGTLTETGRVLGTPQYMAPEQAAGRTREIGPATDVYSLGAILYELLAGRPPFESSASLDLMVRLMTTDPVPVRRLASRVPRDLETITTKCLEKEPRKRYASAAELADDLHRFREGQPIHARPVGYAERAWKWARRRPLIAGLLLSLVLVTLLGFAGVSAAFVYAYKGWSEAEIEHGIARKERATAEGERAIAHREREVAERAVEAETEARRRAETNLTFNRLTRAYFLWRLNNLELSSRELQTIPPAERGWDWRYLQNLHEGALHTITHPGMPEITGLAYSPDGKQLAAAMGNPFLSYQDHKRPAAIVLYDTSTHRRLRTLAGMRDHPRSVAYSPDGKHIAASGVDGYAHVWEVLTGKRVGLIRDPGREAITQVSWSPDGKRLALASLGSLLSIFDIATGNLVWKLHRGDGHVMRVAWSPDGLWIASSADRLRLWDAVTGAPAREFDHHSNNGLAFSPDGRILAGADGNRVRLYDTTTWQPLFGFTAQEGTLGGLAFSPDGQMIATAGSDTTVRLWSVHNGHEMALWRGHHGRVTSVAFHPDGHTLASAGAQPGEVKVWSLCLTPEHTRVAEPGSLPVAHGLAFTPDGSQTLFVRSGGKVECRDVVTGNAKRLLQLPISSAWLVPGTLASVSGDTSRIAGVDAAADNTVRLFDTRTGKTLVPSHSHAQPVWHVAIDQAGNRFASASNPTPKSPGKFVHAVELVVSDANSGKEVLRESWKGRSQALALSRDGRWLACCLEVYAEVSDARTRAPRHFNNSSRVEIWEIPPGPAKARLHLSLPAPLDSLHGVTFSADGTMVAASSGGGRLYLWHLPSGEPVHQDTDPATGLRRIRALPAQQGLESLAFSPDGRLLAGVSRELVKLWDAREGLEVLTLRGAPPRPSDGGFTPRVTWSPDGRRLAISNWDRSVTVWDGAEVGAPKGYQERNQAVRARLPRWYLDNAMVALERRAYAAVEFNLVRLKAFEPLDLDLALRRGEIHARMGRWEEALRDYTRAFEADAMFVLSDWHRFAQLHSHTRDRTGYDHVCDQIRRIFGSSSPHDEADFVRASTFCDGAVPGLDIVRIARTSVEKFPRSGWAHLNLSLAYLRSGKPREAIAPAKQGLIENGVRTRQQPVYWLVLGLANQRLGETDEARKWQLLAETRIDELDNPCRTSPRKTPEDLDWQEWSHMLLLRDELRVALPRTK